MNFKRSALLTVGAVLAASLISSAASSAQQDAAAPKSTVQSHKSTAPSHKSDTESDDTGTVATESDVAPATSDAGTASPNFAPLTPAAQFAMPAASANSTAVAAKSAQATHVSAAQVSGSVSSPITHISPVRPVKPSSTDPGPTPTGNPATIITPTGLATVDSILSYCAQVDRNSASAYQAGFTMVTQGHDNGEIASLRMTPDYAKVQTAINTQLANVSLGTGVLACRAFSSPGRTPYGVSSPIHTHQSGLF